MAAQKKTFLPYTFGLADDELRIGTLVLDPNNPTLGLESKRFDFMEDLDQNEYEEKVKSWTRTYESAPRVLRFNPSQGWSANAGILEMINAGYSTKTEVHAVIAGVRGRRLQVKKPEKFFQEVVMEQKGVLDWITKQTNASLEERRHAKKEGLTDTWRTPRVWVCTGVDLIAGAKVLTGSSTAKSLNGSVSVDIGLLMGMPPIGQSAFVIGGSIDNSQSGGQAIGHKEERVWAAQFFPLFVEREARKLHKPFPGTGHAPVEHTPTLTIKLREIEDLGASAVRRDVQTPNAGPGIRFTETAQIPGLEGADGTLLSFNSQEETPESDPADDNIDDSAYSEASAVDWHEHQTYLHYLTAMEEGEKRRAHVRASISS